MADPSSSSISIPMSSVDPSASTTILEDTPIETGPDSMTGIEASGVEITQVETSGDAGAAENGDRAAQNASGDTMDIETKLSYVDYLKSPVVSITVSQPESAATLSAHLALLQISPYMQAACADFGSDTPVVDRVVVLPDEDLNAVGAFLEFLYTGEYTPRLLSGGSGRPDDLVLEETDAPGIDEEGEQLLKHARVYTLAEKLQMPSLKHLAHSKIHRINSTAKGELRYARFVYKHTGKEDKTIRQPIASFWAHRSHVLRHEADDEFRRMILEFPQFAYDILNIVLDQKEKGKEKRGAEEPIHPSTPVEKVPRTGGRKRARTSAVM